MKSIKKEQIIKTDQVEGTKGNFTMFQFFSRERYPWTTGSSIYYEAVVRVLRHTAFVLNIRFR